MKVPTREEIEEAFDQGIRPLLKADGGDARIERIQDDGTIVISLTGRCAGCPGADDTVEALIEPCLKKRFAKNIRQVMTQPWRLPFHHPS